MLVISCPSKCLNAEKGTVTFFQLPPALNFDENGSKPFASVKILVKELPLIRLGGPFKARVGKLVDTTACLQPTRLPKAHAGKARHS